MFYSIEIKINVKIWPKKMILTLEHNIAYLINGRITKPRKFFEREEVLTSINMEPKTKLG